MSDIIKNYLMFCGRLLFKLTVMKTQIIFRKRKCNTICFYIIASDNIVD